MGSLGFGNDVYHRFKMEHIARQLNYYAVNIPQDYRDLRAKWETENKGAYADPMPYEYAIYAYGCEKFSPVRHGYEYGIVTRVSEAFHGLFNDYVLFYEYNSKKFKVKQFRLMGDYNRV